jgi:hypothetical protein
MVKAEEGDLLQGSGHFMGRGRVSILVILSHLWGTEMNYKFK